MKNWPVVTLSDVFEIARGGSPRPIDSFITDRADGINWIMISDAVEGSKYITRTRKRIRAEGAQRSRAVHPGDFLLTNSMSFGKPYIMRTSGCVHDGWLVLSPRKTDVDSNFFYHLLGSKELYCEFERRASGATVKNLNIDVVKGVAVPLPPVHEQRRIAEILDKADALRAKRRAALVQLDTLTQSIFLDMFGDPANNEKHWRLTRIGDVADVQGGLQLSSTRKQHHRQVPYLRVANVHRRTLDLTVIKTMTASDAEIARTRLVTGDLLVVEGHGNASEIGRSALWDGSIPECVHQNHLIRARFNADRIIPLYACEYLNSSSGRRHLLRAGKTTSGLNTITVSEVRATPIALPPVELQQEFVLRIEAVDQLRSKYSAASRDSDALFASLQHRAFRGEL